MSLLINSKLQSRLDATSILSSVKFFKRMTKPISITVDGDPFVI